MEKNKKYINIPMVITRGMFIFPNNTFYLEVGRSKSIEAILKAQKDYENYVFVVSQIDPSIDDPDAEDLYRFGSIAKIRLVKKRDDGSMRVSLEGLKRAKVELFSEDDYLFYANVVTQDDIYSDNIREAALVRKVAKSIDDLVSVIPNVPQELINEITKGISASALSDMVAQFFPMNIERKQQLLEILDVNERLEIALQEIANEMEISKIEASINEMVQERINENQKDFYLRERMRAIKEELGDGVEKEDEISAIKSRLLNEPFPQSVIDKVSEELKKYEMVPPSSSEANVVRTYIDWIMSLP
ncbi:MAG: LON peptidase substrate-binding domain-containing protein, partial [Bacilli bacterium]